MYKYVCRKGARRWFGLLHLDEDLVIGGANVDPLDRGRHEQNPVSNLHTASNARNNVLPSVLDWRH